MEPKEKILARTGELFRMMGMKALTMDRVAADLGVSKRTIYEYFGDKEALMLASFDYMIKKNNQYLIAVASKSPNVIEAIFVIAEIQHRQMVTSNPIIFDDLKRFFCQAECLLLQQPGEMPGVFGGFQSVGAGQAGRCLQGGAEN